MPGASHGRPRYLHGSSVREFYTFSSSVGACHEMAREQQGNAFGEKDLQESLSREATGPARELSS